MVCLWVDLGIELMLYTRLVFLKKRDQFSLLEGERIIILPELSIRAIFA